MTKSASDFYRRLPAFKGKKRLGTFLFKKYLNHSEDKIIQGKNGLKFHLLNTYDSISRDLFFDGVYEPETVSLIQSILKDGDVMVDAGANIGAISLPVACFKNVQIYAFEPAQHIFKILEKNIKVNRIENIFAIRKALSDFAGITDFYESGKRHGWSGMVRIESFDHYKIQATTLDDFAELNGIQQIKVLKADVQGWEYHVFKGAERLLSAGRIEHIIFEVEWWAEKNACLEIGAAQQFLLDKGYKLFTLSGKPVASPVREGTLMLHAVKG